MIACLITTLFIPSSGIASKQSSVKNAPRSVEQTVRVRFARVPILVKIAKCESRFRQFDEKGKPLRNPGSSATGVMQIMYSVHRKSARKLGLNINTTEGNIEYAHYLYKNEGTRPWNASRHCWQS